MQYSTLDLTSVLYRFMNGLVSMRLKCLFISPSLEFAPATTLLALISKLKGALYRIQILCRRYTFWSYPAELTIADPPG